MESRVKVGQLWWFSKSTTICVVVTKVTGDEVHYKRLCFVEPKKRVTYGLNDEPILDIGTFLAKAERIT